MRHFFTLLASVLEATSRAKLCCQKPIVEPFSFGDSVSQHSQREKELSFWLPLRTALEQLAERARLTPPEAMLFRFEELGMIFATHATPNDIAKYPWLREAISIVAPQP